jgi:hypothetical protein
LTEGWNKLGRGRIYKVSDPEEQKKPIVAEVKKLLAEGFDNFCRATFRCSNIRINRCGWRAVR